MDNVSNDASAKAVVPTGSSEVKPMLKVDDDMVERACAAAYVADGRPNEQFATCHESSKKTWRTLMRAGLEAAFDRRVGEKDRRKVYDPDACFSQGRRLSREDRPGRRATDKKRWQDLPNARDVTCPWCKATHDSRVACGHYLRAKISEAASDRGTAAVGLVPNRTDRLVSLHVGEAWTMLSLDEAKSLAEQIKGYERRAYGCFDDGNRRRKEDRRA